MKGFKDFLMRGNLVELAVAFIMGAAFSDVSKSFTAIIMGLISKVLGGAPDLSAWTVGGINIGAFLMAVVVFFLTAVILYFGLIKPISLLRERFDKKPEKPAAPPAPTELEVLEQIRDLLQPNSPAHS